LTPRRQGAYSQNYESIPPSELDGDFHVVVRRWRIEGCHDRLAARADRVLQGARSGFLKELDGMRLEGRRLIQEAEALRELAANDALSTTAREEKKKGFETKLTDLRAFEVRYDDLKAQREAELQLQATQSNKRILDEVMSATRFVGEKESFNLILNASKANPVASDVVFSKNITDLTEKIVASLNATKPMHTEAPSGTNNVKPK